MSHSVPDRRGNVKSAHQLGRLSPGDLERTNRLCRQFILVSLLYFFVGSLLGVFLLLGWQAVPRFVHLHLNFFGWISMMIFGVGYKLLPNYAGKIVIHSLTMARVQFWLANLGFLGLLIFYALWSARRGQVVFALTIVSAVVLVAAIVLFGLNVWFTFRLAASPADGHSPSQEGE